MLKFISILYLPICKNCNATEFTFLTYVFIESCNDEILLNLNILVFEIDKWINESPEKTIEIVHLYYDNFN